MNKKIIALIAAFVMTAQCIVPVFAIELSPGERSVQARGTYENLRYEIKDGEVTIKGYETNPTGNIEIPEKIEGYPVTTIGDSAFKECYFRAQDCGGNDYAYRNAGDNR